MTRQEYEDALFERAHDYMTDGTPLSDLIEKEDLQTWRVEEERIIYAMETHFTKVPYGKYCILAYQRFNPSYYNRRTENRRTNRILGDYAIYEQIPDEGYDDVLTDSLSYAADFRLRHVNHPIDACPNMVEAVIKAKEIIDIWNSEGR